MICCTRGYIKISSVLIFSLNFVSGVADGVGGWRHYGIDPGEFSSFLMKTCERLVSMGRFTPSEPSGLLARSYFELLENKQPILGELWVLHKLTFFFAVL